MFDIFSYIKKLESEYDTMIKYKEARRKEDELKRVPEALKELYKKTDGICLPFGRVYSLEEAIEHSNTDMYGKCFCFGEDYLNEHIWLCLYEPNEFGGMFNFTTIIKPQKITGLYKDLIDFFEDMRNDYDDDPWIIK